MTQNPVLRWLCDRMLIPLLNLDLIQRRLAQEASKLNMNYRRSSLSDSSFAFEFGVADCIYEICFERRAEHASQNKFHSRIKQCLEFYAMTAPADINPHQIACYSKKVEALTHQICKLTHYP